MWILTQRIDFQAIPTSEMLAIPVFRNQAIHRHELRLLASLLACAPPGWMQV